MPRSGRIRTFIQEIHESPRAEKISFLPPVFILILEVILLVHAVTIHNPDLLVVELTSVLLFVSLIEMVFLVRELHERRQESNFDRIITIKLDDFILQKRYKNVRRIVEDFIQEFPQYQPRGIV